MNIEEIYELGDMLGLDHKEIQNVLSDNKTLNKSKKTTKPSSPVDNYKCGVDYGTISINDF
jgi:hypothetical protein